MKFYKRHHKTSESYKEAFKNLYFIKLEIKLKEMHQVLDSTKPPNLNQEVVQNLKRPITNEDIYHYTKAIIKYNLK